jgi:hypothetical protein
VNKGAFAAAFMSFWDSIDLILFCLGMGCLGGYFWGRWDEKRLQESQERCHNPAHKEMFAPEADADAHDSLSEVERSERGA